MKDGNVGREYEGRKVPREAQAEPYQNKPSTFGVLLDVRES